MKKCFCEEFKEYFEKAKNSTYSSMRISENWWMTRKNEEYTIDTNYDTNTGGFKKLEIKFCPFCGKKLGS